MEELSMSTCNALTLIAIENIRENKDDSEFIKKLTEAEKKYYLGTKETCKIVIENNIPVTFSCPMD